MASSPDQSVELSMLDGDGSVYPDCHQDDCTIRVFQSFSA